MYGKGERPVGFGVGSGVGSTEGNGVDSVMVSVGRSPNEADMEVAVGVGVCVGAGVATLLRAERVAACRLGVALERSRLGGCWGRSGNENQSQEHAQLFSRLPLHLHFCPAFLPGESCRAPSAERAKQRITRKKGGGGGGEVAVHGRERERDGDNPRELDVPLLCDIVIIIADWLKMTVLMS